MKFTVAIDGPAAAGKGTVARAVAAHFGFEHLDTGLLYRAVARQVLAGTDPLIAAKSLTVSDLDAPGLRTPEVAQAASEVAAIAAVRTELLVFQQSFAHQIGGAVLDGRDIGTVVCPDAEVKLFVTASDTVRAQRRYQELVGKGLQVSLTQVQNDLAARDARDRRRMAAPLQQAPDAVLLDTTEMTITQAVQAALRHVAAARAKG